MTKDEALKLALEALKQIDEAMPFPVAKLAQAAIKEALSQPEQEPKCGAIIEVFGKDWRLEYLSLPVGKHKLYTQQYTYTTPPQRKPLSDEEIYKASTEAGMQEHYMGFHSGFIRFARAIEAAHGIKERE